MLWFAISSRTPKYTGSYPAITRVMCGFHGKMSDGNRIAGAISV